MTYYPPQPPPQYQMQPPLPPQPPAQNGMGVAAFVCGLVGVLLSFIPIIGVIAWPLVIVGLVLGIVAVSKASRGRATNKGLSIAGVALSAVGLVICILWAALFGKAASEVEEEANREVSIVYEITGEAKDVSVTYSTFGDNQDLSTNQEEAASLPWRKEIKTKGLVKGGSVVATTGAEGGTVTCKVTIDGAVKATETASGEFKIVTCSGF